jgi:alpha-galactosidase
MENLAMNTRFAGRMAAVALWIGLGAVNGWAAPSSEPSEMQERDRWVSQRLVETNPPLAFIYDGKAATDLLAKWPRKTTITQLNGRRTQRTWTWTDPKTGLEVRCVSVVYADYPVVEWTAYFRNTGSAKTPLLEAVRAIDIQLKRGAGSEFVLRGVRGDDCSPKSYQPYEITLGPKVSKKFAPVGGRPTDSAFPYYNLATPGGGMILAVGWPGQWAAAFARDAEDGLRVTAGQELTHLSLLPGEEIRTPLVAVMFWKGSDVERSQNLWRRWMLACNMPRPGGKPLRALYSFCCCAFFPDYKASEAGEKQFFDALTKQGIKLDYWWMDTGWYSGKTLGEIGEWVPDPTRYPRGVKAVSDYVHARDAKLIVWFEPEFLAAGTAMAKKHPEWFLGGSVLNLGNREARQWLTDHIARTLTEQGIDLYRQDHNIAPLDFWRKNDAADRQGITENLCVQGYLAFWDALRQRHPRMLIDSCASGGRRNDLETLRRSVPLLRSDYQAFDGNPAFALGNQCQTYGLASWIPYYGHGAYYNPNQYLYSVRSSMCPAFAMCVDVRKGQIDWNLYRRLVAQWRQVADCFMGDYYPLTPYSLDEDCWIAWQFDRPEKGDGMVQVFRRGKSSESSRTLRLHGLEPAARYEVTDLDSGKPETATGKELQDQGLAVKIAERPGSALFKYRKSRDQ